MQYREIGTSGIKASVVGLGTWAMGGNHWGPSDDRACIEAIQRSLDLGVTLVDTAPVYGNGHSEELVGLALKGRREKAVVATKCGLLIDQGGRRSLKPEDMRRELDASLKRLQTDVIDVYFCHWPDKATPMEETMQELAAMRKAGKIRCIGLSNHAPELIDRARSVTEVDCLQDQYSLVKRDVEKRQLPYCRKWGLGMFAYGPLGGGVLTGKYREKPGFGEGDIRNHFYPFFKEPLWSRTQALLAQMQAVARRHGVPVAHVAIAWSVARAEVCTSLVGARTREQAEANAGAGDVVLKAEDAALLDEASATVNA